MRLEELREHIRIGREAWPALALSDEDFVRYVSAHVSAQVSTHGSEAGAPLVEHAADLWLASACAMGVPGAAAAFERAHRTTIEQAVGRIDRGAVDDGTQAVLVSLLVRDGDVPPRIAAYEGRAALRSWLAIVAARATLKLRRNMDDRPHESVSALSEAVVEDEPELALAKSRYGPELEAALRDALSRLDARQIVLLRLHHGKHWSVDRLAGVYGVGRSTAARWVAAARAALLEETKRLMHERLRLTSSELGSVLKILQGSLDVSLLRLLDRDGELDE